MRMFKSPSRRRRPSVGRRATGPLLAVLALALATVAVGGGTASAAAAPPPYLAPATDPQVTTLAKDQSIPIEEAQRRMGWQKPAEQMSEEVSRLLGERFGGLWISEADGGRVKLGIVGVGAVESQVRAVIARWKLGAVTDLVEVTTSYAQLERDSAWLGAEHARANKGAALELSSALLVDRNQVELRLPEKGTLTPAQRASVNAARQRLGSRLKTGLWAGTLRHDRCAVAGTADCDAPMRGGVSLYLGTRFQCTTAFNARSRTDGRPFVMTAGHCGLEGTVLSAYQPDKAGYFVLGPVHNAVNSGNDDYSIIWVNNPDGWRPQPWVWVQASADTVNNPNYVIKGVGANTVGTRVCVSGAISGTDCGPVLALNIGGTGGLAQAAYCTAGGDSGAAVYSVNSARGIHVGVLTTEPACRGAVYQGIVEASNALRVDVLTG